MSLCGPSKLAMQPLLTVTLPVPSIEWGQSVISDISLSQDSMFNIPSLSPALAHAYLHPSGRPSDSSKFCSPLFCYRKSFLMNSLLVMANQLTKTLVISMVSLLSVMPSNFVKILCCRGIFDLLAAHLPCICCFL